MEPWQRHWDSRHNQIRESGYRRGCVIQGEVRRRVTHRHRLRGKTVEKMSSSVYGIYPIAGKKRRLKEEAVDHVSGGANNPFVTTVLRGGLGARESQLNTVRDKEMRGGVVELVAIIILEGTDWMETQTNKWVRL